MNTKEKIKVFYSETLDSIKFFSSVTDTSLTMPKTIENFKAFNQVKNSNKYEFVSLV